MFDKICTLLCLHTKAARIAFLICFLSIFVVTLLGVAVMYEPPAAALPPAVSAFQPETLAVQFEAQFGPTQGEAYFSLVTDTIATGDIVLQNYHYLRRLPDGRAALSRREVAESIDALKKQWDESAALLLQAEAPLVRALAEDTEEALELAVTGLTRNMPFIDQRLVKARSMFHDLHDLLQPPDEKSERYYGRTRLGSLVEKGL